MLTKKLFSEKITKAFAFVMVASIFFVACSKKDNLPSPQQTGNDEAALVNDARSLEQTAAAEAEGEGAALGLANTAGRGVARRNIVEIVSGNPNFTTLVAAVVKTGLAGALSDASANLTVFAPTNKAFAQLPAPFNNTANIGSITDGAQIDFLRSVLLYHVLGAEVFSNQVAAGRSSAATIKPAGAANDNTVYFSRTFGLIRINGQSNVIRANLDASNGVVHVINKVLLFPTNTIAGIAIASPDFSVLVAALVKTGLAGVFTESGDFTVFAPTNAAFAQLPSPFNNAENISNIASETEIAALANILKYHVVDSRRFAWDLGILQRTATLAAGPNNKITTLLGYNRGFVKGDANLQFSKITPADILATNGVIHMIDRVLLPK
jgi:uncharacterized surface protein with fasciclin (FAS1) repeats